jgi:thiamine-phosphate pyrophosphorylase
MRPEAGALVVVTDRARAAESGHGLVDVVAAAVEAGARWVLLREKDLPAAERRRLALGLAAVLAPAGGHLIVASDPALAAAVGAAGVHLAATDPWPRAASGMVGRSCHDVCELRDARREGAAYATLSPVLATPSKPGYGPALGLDGLAAACAAVPDLPVLALAGVGPGRAADCLAAGAHGVAVMGEVMGARDPAAVVHALLTELAARRVEA